MKTIRGVWLTNVGSEVLNSRQNIINALNLLADTGFNTVFPVVWNKGFTQYPSQVMLQTFNQEIDPAFAGRDPLAEVIEAAKNVGIDVIPWFEYGFACSYQKNGGHIIASKPHWAAKDINNQLLNKNGFEWMNAFEPEVQNFILSLVLEVARNYDVAGVQGDDRLPALPCEGGYDEKTRARYYSEQGVKPPQNIKDAKWLQWRAALLTNFLGNLSREVKAIKNDLLVSISSHPYPFGYHEYLQDSPTWIRQKIVDVIHPQLYRRTLKDYQALVETTLKQFSPDDLTRLFPGVLIRLNAPGKPQDFHISPEQLWQTILINRRLGIRGEVFFFFEELNVNAQSLAQFLQAKNYAEQIFISAGMRGDDVQEIQRLLQNRGFYRGKLNGNFGFRTKAAVTAFQKANGLKNDGIVGPLTYRQLKFSGIT
ncbi:glycoside hydrolase family 10 protein [Gloeothece verrucosa]|uniref:Glycosyl hydrolase-like 10 domain-containing protein n=1 Tax=Gloeothece verrucosa (strain PCC 7822) TaxID=497965 RepID=E0UE88_GLOV7|nr:family 10 glycosylhydrolase [Gloeothece verrucosa]ADN14213.1 protein of unknown function DUF187 [Gloeothece verrucosa PCC 7822]